MIRILDLTLAIATLVLLSPIFIPIVVLLRFTGEGEVFYLQKRIGLDGVTFNVIKFATMLKGSASMGSGTVTIKNDPRVLPVGKFLRKTKINELPQLLNIVRGDMSIVGPRPLTPDIFSYYKRDQQSKITSVVPGLSGIGSIVFRDEESIMEGKENPQKYYAETIAPYKASLEDWYVRNINSWIYLCVIFLTVLAVLRPGSSLIFKVFRDLPRPPKELEVLFTGSLGAR